YALEVVVVVRPPFVEIPVGEFKDRGGKCVPSLVQVNEKIDFVLLQLHRADLNGVEKACVEQFFSVQIQNFWQVETKDEVTLLEAEFTQNDLVACEPVSQDKDTVDEQKPSYTVGILFCQPWLNLIGRI